MNSPETIKVKPWSSDQGEYVLINADDFDAAVHERAEPPAAPEPAATTKAARKRTATDSEPEGA